MVLDFVLKDVEHVEAPVGGKAEDADEEEHAPTVG